MKKNLFWNTTKHLYGHNNEKKDNYKNRELGAIDPSELRKIVYFLFGGIVISEEITKVLNEKSVRKKLNLITNSDTKSKLHEGKAIKYGNII